MRLDPLRSFSRDIDRLPDARLRARLMQVLLLIESANDLRDVPNLKKMKEHPNAYRIRVGDYRLGVFVFGNLVRLVRFAHRREIYRLFP